MRKRHAVRRGRAVVKKTFGKVPVGGLFQLKDDPDNATLQKVSKAAYVVVTPGHVGRGIKYAIAASYPVKRGRQGKALRGRHKASRRGHARVALKPKFHRDGSVTYWSVYDQAWRRSRSVPDRELAAMPETERNRVVKHTKPG